MTRDTGGDAWVVDASPLIVLGKIGQLHLLQALAAQVVVPAAVVQALDGRARGRDQVGE